MKILVAAFVIFLVVVAIILLIPDTQKPVSVDAQGRVEQDSARSEGTTGPVLGKKEAPAGASISDRVKSLIKGTTVAGDDYLELIKMLEEDEEATLAALGELYYPDDMDSEGPLSEQIQMLVRGMNEFYREAELGDILEKMETLRPSNRLFSDVVGDMFFLGDSKEDADLVYDWIMSNPDDIASMRAGANIGELLVHYQPDQAWEKALTLPAGDTRTRAFSSVIYAVAEKDLGQAIDLINSVDESTTDLDEAISGLLHTSVGKGYKHSDLVDIAVAPMDSKYRFASLNSLFFDWAQNDAAGLEGWLQQSHDYNPDDWAEVQLVAKQSLEKHRVDISTP